MADEETVGRQADARAEAVADALGDWIMVKIDVDKNDDLVERFGVNGYPTFFVLDPKGEVIAALPGALPAESFIR